MSQPASRGLRSAASAAGVPKDRLLGTFWPGKERSTAQRCLGTALHRLHWLLQAQVPGLPDGMVACTRAGVCRLDDRIVHSDAQQVLALLDVMARGQATERQAALAQIRDIVPERGGVWDLSKRRKVEWSAERPAG